jgi:hypothetical protein
MFPIHLFKHLEPEQTSNLCTGIVVRVTHRYGGDHRLVLPSATLVDFIRNQEMHLDQLILSDPKSAVCSGYQKSHLPKAMLPCCPRYLARPMSPRTTRLREAVPVVDVVMALEERKDVVVVRHTITECRKVPASMFKGESLAALPEHRSPRQLVKAKEKRLDSTGPHRRLMSRNCTSKPEILPW